MVIQYDRFTQRLIDILERGRKQIPEINQIKFGRPADEISDEDVEHPWMWVAPADNPIASQKPIGRGGPPDEEIQLEYWCVVVNRGEDREQAQRGIQDVSSRIEALLRKEYRMLDINGHNDLDVITSRQRQIPRNPDSRDHEIAAMNIISYITIINKLT